jgi:ribosome-binding factor A
VTFPKEVTSVTRRTERINGVLRQEISQLLARELNDPRLSGIVSITQIETTSDLRHSKVYISVLGDDKQKETVLGGVNSAARFMRRELGVRLSLRYVPELKFMLDESMEQAEHILTVIDRVSAEVPVDPGSQEARA